MGRFIFPIGIVVNPKTKGNTGSLIRNEFEKTLSIELLIKLKFLDSFMNPVTQKMDTRINDIDQFYSILDEYCQRISQSVTTLDGIRQLWSCLKNISSQ